MMRDWNFRTVPGLYALAALLASALCLAGCEGSATQTTNGPELHGQLVDQDGNPVAGAKVQAWPSTHASGKTIGGDFTPIALTRTDAGGRYSLRDLNAGVYNVFGDKDGKSSVVIPQVRYSSRELDLGADTLKTPGAVSGQVLADGKPREGVFCYIPGSAFITMSDSAGRFTLGHVPSGEYAVKYVATGYSTVLDSPVVVVNAATTTLPPRTLEWDVALQPPSVNGLRASIDTNLAVVNLEWDTVKVSDFLHYLVEIRHGTRTGKPAHTTTPEYPDFVDNFSQYRFRLDSGLDSIEVNYSIWAVDSLGNRSPGPADLTLTLHRTGIQRTGISLMGSGNPDTTACSDTLVLIARLVNPLETMSVQYAWSIRGDYGLEFPVQIYDFKLVEPKSKLTQVDTLKWSWGLGMSPGVAAAIAGLDRPDTLVASVEISFDQEGIYLPLRRVIDIVETSEGCYRALVSRNPRPGE